MIITIVGAGNSGCANAFIAAENGHDVRILKTTKGTTHDKHFETMQKNGGLWAIDNTTRAKYTDFSHEGEKVFQKMAMITREREKAIQGANVIMIFIQTQYHEDLAKNIARYFTHDQLVILVPGYLGSIYYHRHSRETPLFAEGESTAHDARISEPGCVKILFKNVRNSLAYFPADRTEEGQKIASQIFTTYNHTRENIMATALHNPNLIVHTVGMYALKPMMDYCAKYHPDEVPNMYRDALGTEFAWAVVDLLDHEKMAVLEAYGCERIPYLDACKHRNEQDLDKDSRQVFEAYKVITPPGPSRFDFRYITEDVPYGLVLLRSLGNAMNVPTPTCDHMIGVVNRILNTDYNAEGLTLKKLGVDDLSKEQLLDFIQYCKLP